MIVAKRDYYEVLGVKNIKDEIKKHIVNYQKISP